MPVNRLGYLLLFAVPALLPFAWWVGQRTGAPDLAAWLPLVIMQGLLPLLDLAVGARTVNHGPADEARLAAAPYFRWLTLAAVPVQLITLGWALTVATAHGAGQAPFGPWGFAGWLVSTGYVGSILAINVAHELIHKRDRVERWAGGVLLATVAYGSFKVEHVRGHHVHVATPEDPSSAALGMSLYEFLPQAIVRNVANAWRLEARRLAARGRPWWHPTNELWTWTGLSVLLAASAIAIGGLLGLAFFLGQALVAIVCLETINYIEHYGLRRRRLASGRYERPNAAHAWNADALLTGLLLLQLPRHADHHAHATRRFQVLRHFDGSPALPAGYATMFLLAWCPPLWKHIMDPRVAAFEAQGRPALTVAEA